MKLEKIKEQIIKDERSLKRIGIFWIAWLPIMAIGSVLSFVFEMKISGCVYAACAVVSALKIATWR
jgi:hypothetical protein